MDAKVGLATDHQCRGWTYLTLAYQCNVTLRGFIIVFSNSLQLASRCGSAFIPLLCLVLWGKKSQRAIDSTAKV